MKIIVTGSLGHISAPLTNILVQQGHDVTVISSKPGKQSAIEKLGAKAAIGPLEDEQFVNGTFNGADAVYTMVPPVNYFDKSLDLGNFYKKIVSNYKDAIEKTGVPHVVHLSSIGAHLREGSGLILFHRAGEDMLETLTHASVTFMRPVGFYYNLYAFTAMIKAKGIIEANYGADEELVWVAPEDIAIAVAEELIKPGAENKIRYVASDELNGHETARILGEAIGIPGLSWKLVPDAQRLQALVAAGMNPGIAAAMVEMFACQHVGKLTEDYYRHRPALGKTKLTEFAKEFAAAYHKQ